ncbi:predicted protein [Coccidioides posadasii str. Silveira]|uniref:Predicted protein n=2 Tax=Coccidioides posadasii TaxID=199306 RepID=E9CUF0_COCPS|nr:predicted protein [Coccidioides posadasii str. Silveira]KMM64171.1 hypothetical protein CPAG_00523 [Coccidioides posadasii RMSCC 3488]
MSCNASPIANIDVFNRARNCICIDLLSTRLGLPADSNVASLVAMEISHWPDRSQSLRTKLPGMTVWPPYDDLRAKLHGSGFKTLNADLLLECGRLESDVVGRLAIIKKRNKVLDAGRSGGVLLGYLTSIP